MLALWPPVPSFGLSPSAGVQGTAPSDARPPHQRAGSGLQQAAAARSFKKELVLIMVQPNRILDARLFLGNLAKLGMEHVLLMGDSKATCDVLAPLVPRVGCAWDTLALPTLTATLAAWHIRCAASSGGRRHMAGTQVAPIEAQEEHTPRAAPQVPHGCPAGAHGVQRAHVRHGRGVVRRPVPLLQVAALQQLHHHQPSRGPSAQCAGRVAAARLRRVVGGAAHAAFVSTCGLPPQLLGDEFEYHGNVLGNGEAPSEAPCHTAGQCTTTPNATGRVVTPLRSLACAGGQLYVQNARRDGVAAWMLAEITDRYLRWLDDDFKLVTRKGLTDGACSMDQVRRLGGGGVGEATPHTSSGYKKGHQKPRRSLAADNWCGCTPCLSLRTTRVDARLAFHFQRAPAAAGLPQRRPVQHVHRPPAGHQVGRCLRPFRRGAALLSTHERCAAALLSTPGLVPDLPHCCILAA